jgi:mycothiol synthase
MIELPTETPAVAGLRFRHYVGAADIPDMVATNVAVRRANGIAEIPTIETMTNQYANLTNCDPARDLAIVEIDGAMVGYVRVDWSDQTDGSRSYAMTCLLDPDVLGRGIGRAMLAWGEARGREIAGGQAFDGSRSFESETWDPEPPGTRLLTRSGYRPVRTFFEMVRPDLQHIPTPTLPDGFDIRPVRLEDMRMVRDAQIEASRANWDRIDESEEAFARFIGDPGLDPSLHVVAFAGTDVAGAVLNAIEARDDDADPADRRGTLESVFVLAAHRRRGLARALILRSLGLLRERGLTSADLGVDADNANAALDLYQSCGFEVTRANTAWRKPLDAITETR